MGLCIHYTGNIKETGLLKDMIPEVEEIVSMYQWKYTIYQEFTDAEQRITNEITGISFSPPNCENVSLCFLADRTLCDPTYLKYGPLQLPGERYIHSVKMEKPRF